MAGTPFARRSLTEMKVFKKPGRVETHQTNDDHARAQLIAVFEACSACELASTLASDNLARRQASRAGLVACATICGETALALASLQVPDASRVYDELMACRAACVLAREACEGSSDDAVAGRCIVECRRVEDACAAIIGLPGMVSRAMAA